MLKGWYVTKTWSLKIKSFDHHQNDRYLYAQHGGGSLPAERQSTRFKYYNVVDNTITDASDENENIGGVDVSDSHLEHDAVNHVSEVLDDDMWDKVQNMKWFRSIGKHCMISRDWWNKISFIGT